MTEEAIEAINTPGTGRICNEYLEVYFQVNDINVLTITIIHQCLTFMFVSCFLPVNKSAYLFVWLSIAQY